MTHILHKIDSLIEDEYFNISKQYLQSLSKLIKELFEIDSTKENNEFLFDKENDKVTQRFISNCFLRIISNRNYVHINDSKHSILKFIHQSSPEICHLVGITEKMETYEKEKIIRDYVTEKEKECREVGLNDGTLSNINKFQNDLRRITSKRNSIILDFTHELVSKSYLDRIFNKLNEYIGASEETKYDIYLTLKEDLNIYIEEANKIGTKYSNEFIAKPFQKILENVESDILKSPYNIPTTLTVTKTEKKYPLSQNSKGSFSVVVVNTGQGIAKNVQVEIIEYEFQNILIPIVEKNIGNLAFENITIDFDYEVKKTVQSLSLKVQLTWDGFHQSYQSIDIVNLKSQENNIEWDRIKNQEPYNLEPIQNEPELIGRENILQKLRNMQSLPLGSAYIYGQRRVGKTSIVKTLLNSNLDKDLLIYYIEAGDWNDAQNASSSMNNLGEKICKKIKRFNSKFSSLSIPDFNGSFNRITDFLDEVEDIDPKFKLVIILDEFDRISRNLYERGDVGQAFVLTLRSISNRPQFGFILVGGEKLEYILSQWQEFNKFSPVRVDYFSKELDWNDFKKLIQKPVDKILEVSDSAINFIFDETAGNPYFTKKICMELFILMVNNRDVHVTSKEAFEATKIARDSANIGATDFSHFWEDGIKGRIEKEEETSLKRRKVLIAITQTARASKKITKENVADIGAELNLTSIDTDKYLTEFEQRKILSSNDTGYSFVVNFFKLWLLFGGMEKIIATFEEEERVQIYLQMEENAKIKTEEILKLLPKLKMYKGIEIKQQHIRSWIDQFNDVFDQRLIFKLLENFKLYTESEIREKFEFLFTSIKKELTKKGVVRNLDISKKKRDEFLITYLDKSPAKGSSYYTKLFVDQNNIYSGNVCTPENIERKLNEKKNINCIVIIDDFIGSGDTMTSNIKNYFTTELVNIIKEKNIIVIIGIITGFIETKEKIQNLLYNFDIDFRVMLIDVLNENDKCFDLNSNIFSNPSELKKVRNLCEQKGELLVSKNPLGFSNSQTLIAFPMNCPNNTLPIFWKKTENWTPLFERN